MTKQTSLISPSMQPWPVTSFTDIGSAMFLVPDNYLVAGLVIYASGLSQHFETQYMVMSLTTKRLYLCDAIGQYENFWLSRIQRVRIADTSYVILPDLAADGELTFEDLGPGSKGVSLEYSSGGGTEEIILAMLHPTHLHDWRRQIVQARLDRLAILKQQKSRSRS